MHRSNQTDWDLARQRFQQIWGYNDFRYPQGEIVQCLLEKRDTLIVMPTSGGKSICFQLPALLSQGVTLVISPLVALMENQVQELRQRRLPAALLHSELPVHQRRQTLWALENQKLRLLYLSPETLLSPAVWQQLSQPHLMINGLILDEAHCLVQWGDTFRPAYRRLGAIRPALLQSKPQGTRMTIAAFTATADPQAQQTIQNVLQLQQPQAFLQSPYRSNLHLSIKIAWTPRGRRQQLLQYIQTRPRQAGLIYVRTRRDGEGLATWLGQQGYRTAAYHAGLSPAARREIEAAWLGGGMLFVVCTSAFGMGISGQNKVRWVFHFHAPTLLSEYVQEVGRAGRDGEPAEAMMLVSEPTGWLDSEDKQRQHFFLSQEHKHRQIAQKLVGQIPMEGDFNAVARQFKDAGIALSLLHSTGQLEWLDPFHYVINRSAVPRSPLQDKVTQKMTQYLVTRQCRWKFILKNFGFSEAAEDLGQGCGHCDRCFSKRL